MITCSKTIILNALFNKKIKKTKTKPKSNESKKSKKTKSVYKSF